MSQDCNSFGLRQHMYKYPGWFRIMLIVLCFPILIVKRVKITGAHLL